MKVSRNQYDLAISIVKHKPRAGDKFAVSTSQYNDMAYFRQVSNRLNQPVIFGSAATARGFAKRGLIEWNQGWRSGTITVIDPEGLRAIVEAELTA